MSTTTHHRPLHALLGGGVAADLLLWRRRNASAAAVASATVVWFLFERARYSLKSVFSNAILLVVVIVFFWDKSASLLNRLVKKSKAKKDSNKPKRLPERRLSTHDNFRNDSNIKQVSMVCKVDGEKWKYLE